MKGNNDFGPLFWLHLVMIIFAYISPFVISWKLILVCVALYYMQLAIFGNCVLTRMELRIGRAKKTFYHHYLHKAGVTLDEGKLIFVLDYIIPWVILGIAIVWQVGFGHYPLFGNVY